MKEFRQIKLGNLSDSANLESVTSDKPTLSGPKEILIKVKALSINPVDYKIANGSFPIKKPFPRGFGSDVSGVIEAAGDECTKFKVGDEVYADLLAGNPSVFSEYIICSENYVAAKPTKLSFEEAAAVPLAALTALQCIRDHGNFKKGMKVCIFGGSGGVGIAAIQIAKILGASEIVTTSSNTSLCASLGATEVVNYREVDVNETLKGRNFDLVFDCVGGYDYWATANKCMAPGAEFVTITGDHGGMMNTVLKFLIRKFKNKIFLGKKYKFAFKKPSTSDLAQLSEWYDAEKMRVVLDGDLCEFTQSGVTGMFERVQSGRSKGKVVMKVA